MEKGELAKVLTIDTENEIVQRKPKSSLGNRFFLWMQACEELGRAPSDEEWNIWLQKSFESDEAG